MAWSFVVFHKMPMRLYLIVIVLHSIFARNAVNFFISHKKVKRVVVEELETLDNSTARWIEYRYEFESTGDYKHNMNNNNLIIGVFATNGTQFDQVNCQIVKNESGDTYVEGYDVDIIHHVEDRLNISAEFVFIDNLTKLTNNEVDAVICHPNLRLLPSNVIEIHPTIRNNLMLVFKPSKLQVVKDIFLLTFAGSLWVVFFSIMILLGICLQMSTKKYAEISLQHQSWTWVEITLWSIAAACQQGLSHTPSGFASCLIFFLGYLMAYLLYTGFAAAITSILVENVGTDVDLKTLRLEKFRLISLDYVRKHVAPIQAQFLVTEFVKNMDELFETLDNRNRVGVGPEIAVQQYMTNKFNSNQLDEFQTTKLNITYTKGFLMLRDNPWRKLVNQHIVTLSEFGILQNNLRRNLRPVSTFNLDAKYSSAGQEHVGSAIILFLGGAVTALLFFLAELVFYLYKQGQK